MITLSYRNVTAAAVGEHGLDDGDLEAAVSEHGPLCAKFVADADAGAFGFDKLPAAPLADPILAYADEVRGSFRHVVQIGIGGSALGATAIHGALSDRFHNEHALPRFTVLDNVDPEETASLLDRIDPKETLFHVVTKSGGTTETLAGMLVALQRLRDAGADWKRHVVFTTDPEKGFLRDLARREGIRAFDLPGDVGGRFSVLTGVGLLPAALLGLDVRGILAGAAEARERCRRTDPRANPAFMFALLAHRLDTRRGKRIHVMMPYARALRDVADWFKQLWAESLGKTPRVGPTPVVALGTTDQHSQIQLLNEGPNDKFIVFLEAAEFRRDVPLPSVLPADAPPAYLQGRTMAEVMSAMKRGTESALTANGRPNATLRFGEISARTVGEIFYLLEAATVFAGRLYGVDPFDQPGVEAGKKIALSILRGQEAPAPAPDPRTEVR